jgi:hypothetical protein
MFMTKDRDKRLDYRMMAGFWTTASQVAGPGLATDDQEMARAFLV